MSPIELVIALPICKLMLAAASTVKLPVKFDAVAAKRMLSASCKVTSFALVILTISTLFAALLAIKLPAPIISNVRPVAEVNTPLIDRVDAADVVPSWLLSPADTVPVTIAASVPVSVAILAKVIVSAANATSFTLSVLPLATFVPFVTVPSAFACATDKVPSCTLVTPV